MATLIYQLKRDSRAFPCPCKAGLSYQAATRAPASAPLKCGMVLVKLENFSRELFTAHTDLTLLKPLATHALQVAVSLLIYPTSLPAK